MRARRVTGVGIAGLVLVLVLVFVNGGGRLWARDETTPGKVAPHWERENPIPADAPIDGFAGNRPDDLWAYGEGTLLHWDGKAWSRASIKLERWARCCTMTVHAPDDIVAVAQAYHQGDERRASSAETWTFYWDGKLWSLMKHDDGSAPRPKPQATPAPPATPKNAIADAELEKLWSQRRPTQGVVPGRIGQGWRVGREIWAVGTTPRSLVHFDGKSWTVLANVTSGWIGSISARAADDVWATVADPKSFLDYTSPGPAAPEEASHAMLHWDGKNWSRVAMAGPLESVLVPTRDQGWAAGHRGDLVQWDGRSWSATAIGGTKAAWSHVWSPGADDVWLAGCAGAMYHRHGAAWKKVAIPIPDNYAGVCPRLGGALGGDVWAVAQWFVFHWDGKRWSKFEKGIPPDIRLEAVWAAAADDVWAVGQEQVQFAPVAALALHWDGKAWNRVTLPKVEALLTAIWGTSARDVWAVGDHGVILHYDGTAWTRVESGTTEILLAVGGVGDDVRAVGANGTILRWRPAR
jgi:hypothetical protein